MKSVKLEELAELNKDKPGLVKWFSTLAGKVKSLIAYDGTQLIGTLRVFKDTPDGRETVFEEVNLIVLAAKQKILSSIYNNTFTVDPVNTLSVGTGGTVDPQGLFPLTPLPTATGLYNYLLSVSTSFTVNNTVPSVTFIADLDEGTGNGNLITEAGLFTTGGSMFNIKTFPGISKTSEFALHFEWTIEIA
jgi:hypothetical protein